MVSADADLELTTAGAAGSAWADIVQRAVALCGTPCYVCAWEPVEASFQRLRRIRSRVPVRSWLSYKTHPLPALARRWLAAGRGIEVVSECELEAAMSLGATADTVLVNGVAKHAWLGRRAPARIRVHFDSPREIDSLLPIALERRWRVGVRCRVPDEHDARDPRFRGQFGLTANEAVAALRRLQRAGADLQSIHFHLGQGHRDGDAYLRAVRHAAEICHAADFSPPAIDLGGGLSRPGDPRTADLLSGLAAAVREAEACFPGLQEIWLENGRFVTEASAVLAVRVLDVKHRSESRYLICDGGRTNHALAADARQHDLLVLPARRGRPVMTTVCGPTCMTDDRLGRWMLPDDVGAGDLLVWFEAGAYCLPWETRFSHGLAAVVWCDEAGALQIARDRERPAGWAEGARGSGGGLDGR